MSENVTAQRSSSQRKTLKLERTINPGSTRTSSELKGSNQSAKKNCLKILYFIFNLDLMGRPSLDERWRERKERERLQRKDTGSN